MKGSPVAHVPLDGDRSAAGHDDLDLHAGVEPKAHRSHEAQASRRDVEHARVGAPAPGSDGAR
jgi:hypothetical protein